MSKGPQGSIYDFSAQSIKGVPTALTDYKGKVLLIVNTASACGFTPQYAGLESLYKELKPQGFEILGFPCNQFGGQEPGDNAAIQSFCEINFGVTFPLFAKVDVNGDHADPLFKFLKSEAKGLLGSESIKWNFTKFLVGRNGAVLQRFAPQDSPEKIKASIVEALSAR